MFAAQFDWPWFHRVLLLILVGRSCISQHWSDARSKPFQTPPLWKSRKSSPSYWVIKQNFWCLILWFSTQTNIFTWLHTLPQNTEELYLLRWHIPHGSKTLHWMKPKIQSNSLFKALQDNDMKSWPGQSHWRISNTCEADVSMHASMQIQIKNSSNPIGSKMSLF